MERSDLFSLIGKQKKIAQLIAGHPVVKYILSTNTVVKYIWELEIIRPFVVHFKVRLESNCLILQIEM